MLSDEPLRRTLGERARRKAEHSFAVDTMVDRYLEVFAAAAAARAARRLPWISR